MSSSTQLPLRLAAEPLARQKLGNCFILPSEKDENAACLIVGEDGFLGIAMSQQYTDEQLQTYYGCNKECLPRNRLLIPAGGGVSSWSNDPSSAQCRISLQQCACSEPHKCLIPQRVVEGIHKYYARQVLEPSIRGFLSILEKQFPRNDLYLFELLQNAVDDGASIVRFALNAKNNGLEFTHNGKNFTALDVLGLASVGLSTKGVDGNAPKRTIGFMGVGFKAVYKRYARVIITDSKYGFMFQEPNSAASSTIPGHGWVMLPIWTTPDAVTNTDSTGWCKFSLEAPRGGIQSVSQDLRNLPRSIPPLLGRQSLDNFSLRPTSFGPIPTSWTLDWAKTQHCISRPVAKKALRELNPEGARRGFEYSWQGGSERIDVTITAAQGQGHQRSQEQWQFVTLRFAPDEGAKAAYQTHIKRRWSGVGGYEETSIFFELDSSGCPIISAKGAVHAVLPTKLSLPCPLQWQGSWLLSVDRQEVQNVVDNDWNSCLLRQAPKLLGCIMAWLTEEPTLWTNNAIRAVFSLFPAMESGDKGEALVSPLLGQRVSMRPLLDYMATMPSVPCRAPDGKIIFEKSGRIIWLPPPLVTQLGPLGLIEKWFGLLPLATDALHDATCWMELWRHSLRMPTSKLILMNRTRFRPRSGVISLHSQLTILSAFAEALAINVTQAAATFSSSGGSKRTWAAPAAVAASSSPSESVDELCGSWLPPLREWPIFITEDGAEATCGDVVLPSDEWASLSPNIRLLLRPGALLVIEERLGTKSEGGRGPRVALLDATLEEAILYGKAPAESTSRWSVDKLQTNRNELDSALHTHLRNLLETSRQASPANVVTPSAACAQLLVSYASAARRGPVSENVVKICDELFHWAHASGSPSAVSHLLSGKDAQSLRLLPCATAYIGKAYSGSEGGESLELNFPSLPFVYSGYATTASSTKASSMGKFLVECGARRGLSLVASARSIDQRQIQTLGLGSLKLRQKSTSEILSLPFNLGTVNRKQLYEVDVSLASDWTTLCEKRFSPAQASIFCDNLAALQKAFECDEKNALESLPYAQSFLRGKEDRGTSPCARVNETGSQHSTVQSYLPSAAQANTIPLLKRCYYLPPGQAGGSVHPLGMTSLAQQLATAAWLPCSAPGLTGPNALVTMVCRPSECVLIESPSTGNMPVARLSVSTRVALEKLPPALQTKLSWGSVLPKAPVEKLEQLAAEIEQHDNTIGSVDEAWEGRIIADLASVWRALGSAHRDGRLSPAEQQRISKCVLRPKCSIIPRSSDRIPLARVVSLRSAFENGAPFSDEEYVARALVSVGYVMDIQSPASSPHLDANFSDLLRPGTSATSQMCVSFLKDFFDPQSSTTGTHSAGHACFLPDQAPSPMLKRALSWSLFLATKTVPVSKIAGLLPNLNVYCRRGPGFSPSAYPARWIKVFASHPAAKPVFLDDDRKLAGCGISKGSMLKPSHGFQPLGMLDAALSRPADRDDETDRLVGAEKIVLSALGIPRTSDNSQFTLKTAAANPKVELTSASKRLEIVILLLLSLRAGGHDHANARFFPTQMPLLMKCASLSLHFAGPGLETERRETFAVWGGSQSAQSRPLFVQGDPTDYVADLEELILALTYGPHSSARDRPTKVLRLLQVLEDEDLFLKFLHRDFEAFMPDKSALLAALTKANVDTSSVVSAENKVSEVGRGMEQEEETEEDDTVKLHRQLKFSITAAITEKDRIMRDRKADKLKQEQEDAREREQKQRRRQGEEVSAYGPTTSAQENALGSTAAVVLADAFLSNLTHSVLAAGAGRGRQKNLPAWMTEGGQNAPVVGSVSTAVNDNPGALLQSESLGLSDLQTGSNESPPVNVSRTGAGRGVSNLPAWMTAPVGPTTTDMPPLTIDAASAPIQSGQFEDAEEALAPDDPFLGLGEWERHTRGIGRKLLTKFGFSLEDASRHAASTMDISKGSKLAGDKGGLGFGRSVGRGRDRILPSWMASQGEQILGSSSADAQLDGKGMEVPLNSANSVPCNTSVDLSSCDNGDDKCADVEKKRKFEDTGFDQDGDREGKAVRRSSEEAGRTLIERLAAFVSELQRALQCDEVEIEWARNLLVSAIENLTESATVDE